LFVTNGGEVNVAGNINLWSESTIHVEGGSSLNAAGLESAAGGTLEMVLHSGEFAPLITTRNITIISGLLLDISAENGFTADVNDTFQLLAYGGGGLTGTFAGLTEGDTITVGGYDFQLSYGIGGDDFISLNVTAIPEPSTTAAIFGALALLLVMVRRK
jgi:hypothetical protein